MSFDWSDMTAVRIEKYTGERRCQTASHRGGGRPLATVLLYKPEMNPPLPGPEHNFLCIECMAAFLERTGILLPWSQ